jgi:hypothetical protein
MDLYIENGSDGLYVYLDDKTWGHNKLTIKRLDNHCNVYRGNYYIPIEEIMGDVSIELKLQSSSLDRKVTTNDLL